ncbi:MAG: ATP-binding cassette domain-containing protein, partial [Desulfurococcaceae archaeon]
MSSDIIKVENVTAGYQVFQQGIKSLFRKYNIVLRNINLVARDGERIVIIGESGSGKTTLLKVIMGLLKPMSGKVFVMGKDIYSLPWSKRISILRHVGYLPQDPYRALNPSIKIKTILEEPLEAMGVQDKENRVREVLKLVKLDESVLNKYPQDLSGGMR